MQKYLSFLIIILCLQLACTKEVEKIIYPEGDPNSTMGSIVGLVIQKDSNAKVIVKQATVIDSTFINLLDGQFRIDGLQVGNYDLSVKAPYHGTYWIRNVMVHG